MLLIHRVLDVLVHPYLGTEFWYVCVCGVLLQAYLGNMLLVYFLRNLINLFNSTLAFIVAPKLKLSHFACSVGYGFFAWGVSLILSIIFERLYDSFLGLPPALPLVLIGLPAAVKQVS